MALRKYLLITLIFLFKISLIHAQQTIRGYYVDMEDVRRDAVFQFGFDREDYDEFILVGDGGKQVLGPDLTKEVSFENGRLFQSERLPESETPVFVLVMRDGEVDLLKREKNYFVRDGSQIVALRELTSTKDVGGQATKVTTKQYQGVLMSLLKPTPDQGELIQAIRAAGLNDRDLTRVVELYHQLNGLEMEDQRIEKQGPAFAVKLKAQAGIGVQRLVKNFENQGFNYGLESGAAPYAEVGVRFRDFKNAPRLLVDLGIAYYVESDMIQAEASRVSFEFEGKQSFTSGSVVVPLQIQYILSKRNVSEWYAGTGLSFWISSYENDAAEISLDNGEPNLIIHSDDFVTRKPASVSPNLKLGWSRGLSSKSQLFIEAKADLLLKNYEMKPLTYYAIYNLGVLTFSTGIAF